MSKRLRKLSYRNSRSKLEGRTNWPNRRRMKGKSGKKSSKKREK